ncbi:AAA family ATPase [Xanthomonas euvesicatoria]
MSHTSAVEDAVTTSSHDVPQVSAPSPTRPTWSGERKARILLVGGEKGGTGKTTIATNLSVMLARRGRDVLLIDADPQASSTSWAYFRDQGEFQPRISSVQKLGKGLLYEIKHLADRYDDLIIDTGGRDATELRAAMTVADVMICPLQASSFDLWTIRKLTDLIEQVLPINPALQTMVLINRGSTNVFSRDTNEATEAIAAEMDQFDGLSLLSTELHERLAYRRAAGAGKVVGEWDDAKAIDEMEKLYGEIYGDV